MTFDDPRPLPYRVLKSRSSSSVFLPERRALPRLGLDSPVHAEPISFKFSIVRLVVLFLIALAIGLALSGPGKLHPFNIYLTVIWSLYFPIAVVGVLGVLSSRKHEPSRSQKAVGSTVIFLVPTIGRTDVEPGLIRVIDSILHFAPSNLSDFRVDVVLEAGAPITEGLRRRYRRSPHVRLIEVPKDYTTPNGTRYKARANQYALDRRNTDGESGDRTFVYHLDDDTAVGRDTIASIAEFIAKDTGYYHLAQGVLVFPHHLSPSWLCRMADSVRPADDLTRFHFFTGMRGTPLAGLHGEHLLIRASAESEIGWDFGPNTTVEDAYFALQFAQRYPARSAFLNSCTYGASPARVSDLIKQRRRWASGLLKLVVDARLPWTVRVPLFYSVINWTFGIVQHVGVVLLVAAFLGDFNTSPSFQGVMVIWCFNLSYNIWMYLEGLRLNLQASGLMRKYVQYALLTLVMMAPLSLMEAWAAMLGFYDCITRRSGFVVISKSR
ncbi:MAG: glycosyltransferase family 2 protein [Chloroflexota bacterium]|nr:glycosyltransferase family 2 protein [Chloroflexota bacterium]